MKVRSDRSLSIDTSPAAGPCRKACGLVHRTGLRIHLIYNGEAVDEGNVLLDVPVKRPGYTHAAFIIESMDELVA